MTNNGADSFGFLLNGTKFTSLQYPGSSFTQALGVNSNGEVVGDLHQQHWRNGRLPIR
jgi:hypothetical protein